MKINALLYVCCACVCHAQVSSAEDNPCETEMDVSRKKSDMFSKLMHMFIMPYIVQSAMLPFMLLSIKFMLLKTFVVGKIAVILLVLNALRRNDLENSENAYTNQLLAQNYGYKGMEIGAWVNH